MANPINAAIYDFSQTNPIAAALPESPSGAGLFVVCHADDVPYLSERFGWDDETAVECLNLDETVRYTAYDGYDFISLIHIDIAGAAFTQREINLFVSKRYLVLVLPDNEGRRLKMFADGLRKAAETHAGQKDVLNRLYYLILSTLAADFSDTLEQLEDDIEALSERVAASPAKSQLDEIAALRKAAYAAKKVLRALSYIGGEILIDENKLLDKEQTHYFRGIDTRLKKLHDFADSLYESGGEILRIYDSKLSIKMNETVNKLTVITLFFGPLTVITGVYGMNFTRMPELQWPWGYPAALGLMAAVSLGIFVVMKVKKWL